VLAQLHRHHAGDGVRMVRRRDGDGVDALSFFIEQRAKILVAFRLGKCRERLRALTVIDIAERIDVLGLAHTTHVVGTHAADADARDVELVTGRYMMAPQDVRRHDRERDPTRQVADEPTARNPLPAHGSTRILMLRKATRSPWS